MKVQGREGAGENVGKYEIHLSVSAMEGSQCFSGYPDHRVWGNVLVGPAFCGFSVSPANKQAHLEKLSRGKLW